MSKLISLEGIEGAGKSTALRIVDSLLKQRGLTPCITREPGGTPFAEQIRSLLLHTKIDEPVSPETELLLMFAARAQHLHHVILPALKENRWVVTDRYIDATYAYQGGGRGIPEKDIRCLDDWLLQGRYPDLTILLDIDPIIGLQRTKARGATVDRIESETIAFFERVRESYLNRAKEDPKRIRVIDASLPLSQIEHQISQLIFEMVSGS